MQHSIYTRAPFRTQIQFEKGLSWFVLRNLSNFAKMHIISFFCIPIYCSAKNQRRVFSNLHSTEVFCAKLIPNNEDFLAVDVAQWTQRSLSIPKFESSLQPFIIKNTYLLSMWEGSGFGSVGKAVASNSRGPLFKSSHRQKKFEHCLLSTVLKRRK